MPEFKVSFAITGTGFAFVEAPDEDAARTIFEGNDDLHVPYFLNYSIVAVTLRDRSKPNG